MNWTIPSDVGRAATKIAVAGVLFAAPVAAFGAPAAFAATGFGDTPSVLPAPPPADPPPPPAPPGPQHNYEYYNPNDANDWWYNMGSDGGGGGGGGG